MTADCLRCQLPRPVVQLVRFAKEIVNSRVQKSLANGNRPTPGGTPKPSVEPGLKTDRSRPRIRRNAGAKFQPVTPPITDPQSLTRWHRESSEQLHASFEDPDDVSADSQRVSGHFPG